jgi:hypothetical protein
VIALLQRLGHRETVLGFVGWSLFAVVVMHVCASLLAAGYAAESVPVVATVATVALGALMGRSVSRRGAGLAIAFVAVNAVPVALAGAIVTTFTPQLGLPLLGAPVLLAVGSGIGIALQRGGAGYQNPGSAAIGAGAAVATFTIGAWLSLGAMDALLGRGVVEIYAYLAEYDCLDARRARLAEAIQTLGSEHNRGRVERALASSHARRCEN